MSKWTVSHHGIQNLYQLVVLEHARASSQRLARWRQTELVMKDPGKPGDLAVSERITANQMLLLDDINSFWEFLNASVEYAVAAFKLWFTPGGTEVELCGRKVHPPGAMPGLGAGPMDWWEAVACARILRRTDALQSLLEYDHAKFRQGPGQRDEYRYTMAAAVQAYYLNLPDFDSLAEKAEDQGSPALATISGPRLAKSDVAVLEVMRSVRRNDNTRFNDASVAALKAFKAFWGTGKNKSKPSSYHAWNIIALAVDAESRGLHFEVESDYAPRWIIDGPAPGLMDKLAALRHPPKI